MRESGEGGGMEQGRRGGGGREREREEGDDALLSVPSTPAPYTPAAKLVTVVTDRRAALRGKRGA